ncbi:MAG: FAD-dependent oxidoreductase [Chloroflexi bacterium]|nr:MAG: FAD-dependent oxidoreductase [Chloroflexota bacterium]
MTGAALTPGAQRSWWLREALAAESAAPCPPLSGDRTTDVVIVGGGFTGLWTAYWLTERNPHLGITVLEQDICGGGPSGRNGGFASGWWDELDGLVKLYGTEAAVKASREISRSISGIEEFCSRHGVDAWFRRAGYIFAATGPRHELVCEEMVHAAAEAGAPDEMQSLTREQVRERCSSPAFRSGAFMRDGASVQPALLARGLRRVVLERGVTIHEGTTVTRLDGGPTAVTERGSVRAKHAVLAVNAWATSWPRIGRRVAAWSSYIVLTEPAPEKLEKKAFVCSSRAGPRCRSSTGGAGRSTSRPPTCRCSGRCLRATCTSPWATRATASRHLTWRAESWPTWPRKRTPTLSTCQWSIRSRGCSRRNHCGRWGPRWCAAPSSRSTRPRSEASVRTRWRQRSRICRAGWDIYWAPSGSLPAMRGVRWGRQVRQGPSPHAGRSARPSRAGWGRQLRQPWLTETRTGDRFGPNL